MKKQKLLKYIIIFQLFVLCFIPALAGTNDYYSFTMNHRYVDGSKFGQYYYANKNDKIYLKGKHYSEKIDITSTPKPYDVTYYLYREATIFNKYIGDFTVTGETTSFNKYIGTADEKNYKYYLLATKLNEDHWKTVGDGKFIRK